jgi:hypothetical protein
MMMTNGCERMEKKGKRKKKSKKSKAGENVTAPPRPSMQMQRYG